MNELARHTTALHEIILYADSISGEWNGDDAGRLEDRATAADEITEKANELRQLLEELEEM
jgi:hypothetical protein